MPSTSNTNEFQQTVMQYYAEHARSMPWRDSPTAYFVVVSEIMLQQTQVERVIPKFESFVNRFPSFDSLAKAPFSEVLLAWSGLGYNRRAKYLHGLAKIVVTKYKSNLPSDVATLIELPGIGKNTAGAIMAYAFNQPCAFIETNIRSVYIHHFFAGQEKVSDAQLLPLIESTLDTTNPREWYWALMDYGSYLKSIHPNPSRASKHHIKQTKFEGSVRQIRGKVLKQLIVRPQTKAELALQIQDERLAEVLKNLLAESMIEIVGGRYRIKT